MASFYGGKQGITYNLVERYDKLFFDIDNQEYIKIIGNTTSNIQENQIFSITTNNNVRFYMALSSITNCSTASTFEDTQAVELKGMINCFSKGGAYTDVNFGEYVIIDTIANLHQQNNQQNGLLYRRGFQYQVPYSENYKDPGAGAIYVGQIVGPQGENTQIHIVDWGTHQGTGTSAEIAVPGLEEENETATFNDKAVVKIVNNQDVYGNINSADLQLQIPYPIIKLSASTVDTATGATSVWHEYYNDEGVPTSVEWEAGQTFIHKAETQHPHPYYLDYQIAIPKGDKGDQGDTGNGIASMGIQNGYVWVHYTQDESPETKHNLGLTGSAYTVGDVFDSLSDLVTAHPNGFWANEGSEDATPLGYTALVKEVPEGSGTTHTYIYAYDIINDYGEHPQNGWKKAYDLGSSEIVAQKFINIKTNTQEGFPQLLEDGGFVFVNYIPPQEGD